MIKWSENGNITLLFEVFAIALIEREIPVNRVAEMLGVDPRLNMDLSSAFIAGAVGYFPVTEITFGWFHVVKLLNEAMGEVRKDESKEHAPS